MTESCSCITAHPPDFYDYKYAHAVGTICASTEIKLIKEDGTEAGLDEPGEILARGPQVFPPLFSYRALTTNQSQIRW